MRSLCKDWELFGHKYSVADAKVPKVDCKACHTPVAAATNRLKSHLRKCPARSHTQEAREEPPTLLNHRTSLSDAIASELAEHASPSAAEQAENSTENNGPPAKKPRQSVARPRSAAVNEDELLWFNLVGGPTTTTPVAQSIAVSVLNKRRLELEERRLQLEIDKDQRAQRREEFELQILEAHATNEKLLVVKHEYEVKVALALSRKELRDEGVSEDEIDRILPISTPQTSPRSREFAGRTSEVAVSTSTTDSPSYK